MFKHLLKDAAVRRGFILELKKIIRWNAGWLAGIFLYRIVMGKPLTDDLISPAAGVGAVVLCWAISVFRTVDQILKNASGDNRDD